MEFTSKSKVEEQKETYYVKMSFNNNEANDEVHFPVNPSSVEVSEAGQGKTYNVPGIGEINVIGSKSLSEISFSGLFPARYYPFVIVEEKKLLQPVEYIMRINKWMRAKHPVRFILSSDTYEINTPASIESFTWSETAGGMGDIEYSIKLKQFKFYRARKLTSSATASNNGPARPNDKAQPKTHKIAPGDTLWSLAKKYLGSDSRWPEIKKLNGFTDADVHSLPIGKVVKLP